MQISKFELLGKSFGYCLGLVTASISFIRRSRMFHPNGILFEAQVSSAELPENALVRLSSGWWKTKEWPDALGIAVRISRRPIENIIPQKEDQDLLFVSFSSPWQLPLAPFITNFKDYLGNEYFSVAPFEYREKIVQLKLVPKFSCLSQGSRKEKLMEGLLESQIVFILYRRAITDKDWIQMAEIKLLRILNFDQEALRFFPFQCGLGIRPRGLLQYMRIGTYKLSQWARPASGIPAEN